jgi:hypothetical protein
MGDIRDQVAADAPRVRHLSETYNVTVHDRRESMPCDGLYVTAVVGDLVLYLTRERPYALEPWRTSCTHGWFENLDQLEARLKSVGLPTQDLINSLVPAQ